MLTGLANVWLDLVGVCGKNRASRPFGFPFWSGWPAAGPSLSISRSVPGPCRKPRQFYFMFMPKRETGMDACINVEPILTLQPHRNITQTLVVSHWLSCRLDWTNGRAEQWSGESTSLLAKPYDVREAAKFRSCRVHVDPAARACSLILLGNGLWMALSTESTRAGKDRSAVSPLIDSTGCDVTGSVRLGRPRGC